MQKEAIIKIFLRKLVNSNTWGGKHTAETNLRKSLPKHLRGEKIVNDTIKELISSGILKCKISTKEKHISLNPKMKQEIHQILDASLENI